MASAKKTVLQRHLPSYLRNWPLNIFYYDGKQTHSNTIVTLFIIMLPSV